MRNAARYKLLLIEDNDDHAEVVEFYLREFCKNLDIVRLSDGSLAIEYANAMSETKELPHLILLDLKLPKYDGHEILQHIKKNEILRTVPVVVLTTSNSRKDVKKALEAGANSYILKPMEVGKFRDILEQIINYWRMNETI